MTQFAIRPLVRDDIYAVKAIAEATDLFPPEMVEDMTAGCLNGTTDDIWFVYTAPTVTAFGYCEPERMTDGTWNLLALAVDPETQSMGIGAAMLAWIEDRLKQRNQRLLVVDTADDDAFSTQRAFYTRNGYSQVGHIPQFYDTDTGKVTFLKKLTAG